VSVRALVVPLAFATVRVLGEASPAPAQSAALPIDSTQSIVVNVLGLNLPDGIVGP
jgi:hypothetical protein